MEESTVAATWGTIAYLVLERHQLEHFSTLFET
jgi:hypothetical protein